MNEAAKIHVADVIVVAIVSIATIALSPVYYDLIGRVSTEADPLSQLLLQLILPFIFLGIIISAGVSARRRA